MITRKLWAINRLKACQWNGYDPIPGLELQQYPIDEDYDRASRLEIKKIPLHIDRDSFQSSEEEEEK